MPIGPANTESREDLDRVSHDELLALVIELSARIAELQAEVEELRATVHTHAGAASMSENVRRLCMTLFRHSLPKEVVQLLERLDPQIDTNDALASAVEDIRRTAEAKRQEKAGVPGPTAKRPSAGR